MKEILIAALAFWNVTTAELYSQTGQDISKTQAAGQNPVKLLLPSALYAVPGTELNVYFDNIVQVQDIKSLNFDVDCKFGRQDQDRWRLTPTDGDVGSFPLRIKVYDESSKLLADASTTVFVSPKDSGKGKNISVMLVGASTTESTKYPQELYDLFKKDEGLDVKFVGTNNKGGSSGIVDKEALVRHEGRGGWTWTSYCTIFENPKENRPNYTSSPFVIKKDGKIVLDFKNYCDKNNEGKTPDYITVFLGINDIAGANDTNIEVTADNSLKSAEMLINEFRRVAPEAKIGITLIPPPAASQDAFGENYKCGLKRWQYRKNQHYYVERMMRKFGGCGSENTSLIPVYVNLDCVNNYPQKEEQVNARNPKKVFRGSNGVHPAQEGYLQIADSFYAWFKFELNKNNVGEKKVDRPATQQ